MSNQHTTIRPLGRAGDLGWMVMAHGELYLKELGWDTSFEALVAKIVADYAANHDPARETAWIAEVDVAGPAACSASLQMGRPHSFGSCWWTRGLGVTASAGGWSTSA